MAGCFRTIVCKGYANADAVVVNFFPTAELANVRAFYDGEANPLWRQGREEGWLVGSLRRDYFEPALYRGQEGPPPSLAPGAGLTFCGHGLTVGFKTWASYFTSAGADEKHAKLQVTASVAGPLLAGCTNLVPPGPAVLHVHSTPAAAAELAASFTADGKEIKEALNLGVIRLPVYARPAAVVADLAGYGAGAAATPAAGPPPLASNWHRRPVLAAHLRRGGRYIPQAICCAAGSDSEEEADEMARAREAARLRLDEAAKASEWDELGSQLVDDDMAMLKERLELQSSTEQQLAEIKDMLRTMSSAVGISFVDEKDQVTSSAYVFVALNVLIFLYAANVLLVQPILATVAVAGGGGGGSGLSGF